MLLLLCPHRSPLWLAAPSASCLQIVSELDVVSRTVPTNSLCDVWEGQIHRKEARHSWDAWEGKPPHHSLQDDPNVLLEQSQVQAPMFGSNSSTLTILVGISVGAEPYSIQ